MQLHILGSNSAGNCYILQNGAEALIIECGVHIREIKKSLGFNLTKVVGCLISHEHGDHAKGLHAVLESGVKTYASSGTIHACMGQRMHHRLFAIQAGKQFSLGKFKILPFDIKHDAAEPLGFVIHHPETGNVLFLTDTCYSKYKFRELHNIIVEANYAQDIVDRKVAEGGLKFLRDRVLESHLSIDTCKELLQANDLRAVNNIVLIHLSDSNSDAARFKREVQELTAKSVHVAQKGMIIPFTKAPF